MSEKTILTDCTQVKSLLISSATLGELKIIMRMVDLQSLLSLSIYLLVYSTCFSDLRVAL